MCVCVCVYIYIERNSERKRLTIKNWLLQLLKWANFKIYRVSQPPGDSEKPSVYFQSEKA